MSDPIGQDVVDDVVEVRDPPPRERNRPSRTMRAGQIVVRSARETSACCASCRSTVQLLVYDGVAAAEALRERGWDVLDADAYCASCAPHVARRRGTADGGLVVAGPEAGPHRFRLYATGTGRRGPEVCVDCGAVRGELTGRRPCPGPQVDPRDEEIERLRYRVEELEDERLEATAPPVEDTVEEAPTEAPEAAEAPPEVEAPPAPRAPRKAT